MSTCKSCGAPIRWAKTKYGKLIPLDPEPREHGNVELTQGPGAPVAHVVGTVATGQTALFGARRYVSHFATCPDAKEHRR